MNLTFIDFEMLTENQMQFKGIDWEAQVDRFDQAPNFEHEYKPEHKLKDKLCHNCLSNLYVEIHKDIDYPYVCLICDENMYEFETIKEVA